MQVNEPFPHPNTSDNAEVLGDGETTVRGDEPPMSDLDGSLPPNTSPAVSVNGEDDIETAETIYRKQKRNTSIELLDERNVAHKPFGAHTRSDRRERSGDTEESHREGIPGVLDAGDVDTPAMGVNTEPNACSAANGSKDRYQPGTSRSAKASRKLREDVKNGTHTVHARKLETWRTKISRIDPDVRFDEKNPRKVFHAQCAQWILVKEPGDTTRFKQHVQTCQAKSVPVGGTLIGMGWLKKVEKDGGKKGSLERRPTMPCRGVTGLDDVLVDQYLNRTGAGGGGARSIHVISKERFGTEYRNLSRSQKDEVNATQRAEWVWRNDHLNCRVHATNCDGFTSSRSFAASLCLKCKSLLDLKVFTVAIRRKIPLDENMKYVNARYVNSLLLHLYAKIHGLRNIIEQPVSDTCYRYLTLIYDDLSECKIHSLHQICGSCAQWEGYKRGFQWLTGGDVH